ncbi:MAG: helix-turn-helix domain-containing protein [Clostridia bacterium]|nr:helix-turn-helix domain-containing protein [Clostridia bacterium]
MEDFEFRETLSKAVDGDKESIVKIIDMYMPSILKNSVDYTTRQVDEDCVSEIIEKLYKKIKNFKNI